MWRLCVFVCEKEKSENKAFLSFKKTPQQEALREWHGHIRSQEAEVMESPWWQGSQDLVTMARGGQAPVYGVNSCAGRQERGDVKQYFVVETRVPKYSRSLGSLIQQRWL